MAAASLLHQASPAKRAVIAVAAVNAVVLTLCALSILSAHVMQSRGRSVGKQAKIMVKEAVRNSAHWSTAAEQDANPLLGVMHANFAHSYLNIARTLTSDTEVEQSAKINLDEFSRSVSQTQRNAVQKLLAVCPSVRPDGLTAIHTGWMA